MLPYDPQEVTRLLGREPWRSLSEPRAKVLRAAAVAWLRTDPPQSYEQYLALGTEDGYCETLTVSRDRGERSARINPRGSDFRKRPPPEWYVLISAIRQFSGVPHRTVSHASPTPAMPATPPRH